MESACARRHKCASCDICVLRLPNVIPLYYTWYPLPSPFERKSPHIHLTAHGFSIHFGLYSSYHWFGGLRPRCPMLICIDMGIEVSL
jgi:hypothetical protein